MNDETLKENSKPKPENQSARELLKEENEISKSSGHIIVELIEYIPNSVLIKTILKKITGNVTISSFYYGEELTEKVSPFDIYIQIIDGKAEIIINKKSSILLTGQGIVIPAHSSHIIRASDRFKMIQTIIKSGYE